MLLISCEFQPISICDFIFTSHDLDKIYSDSTSMMRDVVKIDITETHVEIKRQLTSTANDVRTLKLACWQWLNSFESQIWKSPNPTDNPQLYIYIWKYFIPSMTWFLNIYSSLFLCWDSIVYFLRDANVCTPWLCSRFPSFPAKHAMFFWFLNPKQPVI